MSRNSSNVEVVRKEISFFHPLKVTFKVFMLILICVSNMGLGFCNDNPNALQDVIMNTMDVSAFSYSMLITFSALPNIIMAVFSGIIVDYIISLRKSTILFAFLVLLGQATFTLGATYKLFWLMIIGRLIFGSAAESMAVVSNKYAGIWLKGPLISIFFAFQQTTIKSMEFLNMFYMHKIYDFFSGIFASKPRNMVLGLSFTIGICVCLISLISSCILALLDYYGQKKSDHIIESVKDEKFKFKDIKYLPFRFWLLSVICALFYSASTTYNGLSLSYIGSRYVLTSNKAAEIQSIYILVIIFFSPIMGLITSKTGYELYIILISGVICTVSHSLLTFTFISPEIILPIYSIGTGIRNIVLWPMVSYIVPDNRLGLAYGVMQTIQNIALTFSPIIAGKISDDYGFLAFEVFILFLTCASLAGIILLFVRDRMFSIESILAASFKRRKCQEDLRNLLNQEESDE